MLRVPMLFLLALHNRKILGISHSACWRRTRCPLRKVLYSSLFALNFQLMRVDRYIHLSSQLMPPHTSSRLLR